MATIEFPPDFSEFSRLLTAHDVEFMVVGGRPKELDDLQHLP